jgi:gamma-glutamyltranspeptidase/glutathione hydrolase
VLRQPALARTLRELAGGGARALYAGPIGARLVDGFRAAGGAFDLVDLAAFEPVLERPLRAPFRDLEVLTSPPNSSGVLLLQALLALEATGAGDPLGADAAVLAEIFRAGAEDRGRRLGDPRHVAVDADAWLGRGRIDEIAARATAPSGQPPFAEPAARPNGDTVAIVAVDGSGTAVSLIQSLFHGFGSGVLEPETGLLLHNRGVMFSLERGHPNELAPGRRPAHTLMPVLVERGGRLTGVLGTMGGMVHAQIHVQVLLRLLAGEDPQAAVDAPRWLVGGLRAGERDSTVLMEDGCREAARTALARAGLPIVELPRWSGRLGHAQAIWLDPDPRAGSDRRADGAPAAFG